MSSIILCSVSGDASQSEEHPQRSGEIEGKKIYELIKRRNPGREQMIFMA